MDTETELNVVKWQWLCEKLCFPDEKSVKMKANGCKWDRNRHKVLRAGVTPKVTSQAAVAHVAPERERRDVRKLPMDAIRKPPLRRGGLFVMGGADSGA